MTEGGFQKFVDRNGGGCKVCRFFDVRPDVERDILDTLAKGGYVLRRAILVTSYLEQFGVMATRGQVSKHFQRHRRANAEPEGR